MSIEERAIVTTTPSVAANTNLDDGDEAVLEYTRAMLQSLQKLNSGNPILRHLMFLAMTEADYTISLRRDRAETELDAGFRDSGTKP